MGDQRKDRRLCKPEAQCGRQGNQGVSDLGLIVKRVDPRPRSSASETERAAVFEEGVCFLIVTGMHSD